jgi:hypothetical protein
MAMRAITAMFDSEADANSARQQLMDHGLDENQTRVLSQPPTSATSSDGSNERRGVFSSIKGLFHGHEHGAEYEEGVRRGGAVLIAVVDEDDIDEAIVIIDAAQPVDLSERAEQWRAEGWTGGSDESDEQIHAGSFRGERRSVRTSPAGRRRPH